MHWFYLHSLEGSQDRTESTPNNALLRDPAPVRLRTLLPNSSPVLSPEKGRNLSSAGYHAAPVIPVDMTP